MSASITFRTEDQERQLRQMAEAITVSGVKLALEKVNPDREGLQRLLGQGDEIKSAMADFWLNQLRYRAVTNQYADEEVESSYRYLSGYSPKNVVVQLGCLQHLFPDLGFPQPSITMTQQLPEGAEGWFAIPRWEKIAPTYGEAVQKVLDLIKQARGGRFYNYRENQLGPEYLRQHEHSLDMWKQIGEAQTGRDILVVPAQFGLRHRGRSVRRAREVFGANEFGLGAYAVGIMLLTHPERLQQLNDLWIDCAGDEFAPVADGRFDLAPYFNFHDGSVKFGTRWVSDCHDDYGSASAFLPQ